MHDLAETLTKSAGEGEEGGREKGRKTRADITVCVLLVLVLCCVNIHTRAFTCLRL